MCNTGSFWIWVKITIQGKKNNNDVILLVLIGVQLLKLANLITAHKHKQFGLVEKKFKTLYRTFVIPPVYKML